MNDANAKQQITERIKNVTNILVTVSTNPTVDELSAALGLTLMLNKLDKHATAVFSGSIPPAITFLDPTKTFENTVDSLRDFIIALDKEKADRLRYRVEDDVVRIFITPYRTRISEEDLRFTHGDFNVELVLALGVENKEVLDTAIAAHGRILHDATVVTINAQNKTSDLGSIAWQDPDASSLCEMLVSMGESLQAGLLDEQIATALLTGIVAATNRFSNRQTSPKSMTMAAQLMAAGANQQLIAAKLEETLAISPEDKPDVDGATKLTEGSSKKVRDKPPAETAANNSEDTKHKKDDLGEITISHDGNETAPTEVAPEKPPYLDSATIEEHEEHNKQVAGEEALSVALEKLDATTSTASLPTLNDEIEKASLTTYDDVPSTKPVKQEESDDSKTWRNQTLLEPSMGGQLNATTKEAEEAKRKEEDSKLNKVIMDHGPAAPPPLKGRTISPPSSHDEAHSAEASQPSTLAEIEDSLKSHTPPSSQDVSPTANALPALPSAAPLPDLSQPIFSSPASSALPPPPPLPDFSGLPPLPPSGPGALPPLDANGLPLPAPNTSVSAPPPPPASNEPGQFRIPGQ